MSEMLKKWNEEKKEYIDMEELEELGKMLWREKEYKEVMKELRKTVERYLNDAEVWEEMQRQSWFEKEVLEELKVEVEIRQFWKRARIKAWKEGWMKEEFGLCTYCSRDETDLCEIEIWWEYRTLRCKRCGMKW